MDSEPATVSKYKVSGITCMSCVKCVREAVANVPGVRTVDLDLDGTLDVTWDQPGPSTAQADMMVLAGVSKGGKTARVRDRHPGASQASGSRSTADGGGSSAVTTYLVSGITCMNCVRHVREEVDKIPGVRETALNLDGALDLTWHLPPPSTAKADEAVLAAVGKAGKKAKVRDRLPSTMKASGGPRGPPPGPPPPPAASVEAGGRGPRTTLSVYTVDGLHNATHAGRIKDSVAAVPNVAAVEMSQLTGVLTVIAEARPSEGATGPGGNARGSGRGSGGDAVIDTGARGYDDALVVGSTPSLVGRVLAAVVAAGSRATPWQLPGVGAGTGASDDRPRVSPTDGNRGSVSNGGGGGGVGSGWVPSAPSFPGSTAAGSAESRDGGSSSWSSVPQSGWFSALTSQRGLPRGASSARSKSRSPRAGARGRGWGAPPVGVGATTHPKGVGLDCYGRDRSFRHGDAVGVDAEGDDDGCVGIGASNDSDCRTCGAPSTAGESIASPSTLALSMVLSSAAARANAAATGAQRGAGGGGNPQLRLTVGGMTCSACVGKARSTLEEVHGVTQARVNLLAARATVHLTQQAGSSVEAANVVGAAATTALSGCGYDAVVVGMTGVTGADNESGGGGGGLRANVTLLRFESHDAAVEAVELLRRSPGVAAARLVESPTEVVKGGGSLADLTERRSVSFDTAGGVGASLGGRTSRIQALLRTTSRLMRLSSALSSPTDSEAGTIRGSVDEEAPPMARTADHRDCAGRKSRLAGKKGNTKEGRLWSGVTAAANSVTRLFGRRKTLPTIVWLQAVSADAVAGTGQAGEMAAAAAAAVAAAGGGPAAGGGRGGGGLNAKAPPLGTPGVTAKVAVVMAFQALHGESLPFSVVSANEVAGVASATDAQDALKREARKYLRLFLFATIFTLPLFLLTMVAKHIPVVHDRLVESISGSAHLPLLDVVAWILATPVQFIAGATFYRGAYYAAKKRRSTMDTLIVLGTTIAYGFSVVVVILTAVQTSQGRSIGHDGPVTESTVFETAALLLTVVLFGKWLEALAKGRAAAGVAALACLQPPTATIMSPDGTTIVAEDVPAALLSIGDVVRVKPGAGFPVDGDLIEPDGGGSSGHVDDIEGRVTADEKMLTGESRPVTKYDGDFIYGGTLNCGRAAAVMRASAVGVDAALNQVVRLVDDAQSNRAPIEAFADVVSAVFVPAIVFVAVVTFAVWYGLVKSSSVPERWSASEGDGLFSLLFSLAVLVIACPCALGLATPTVVMVATAMGATKHFILFKGGGDALQTASGLGAVLFDKTGTLTRGEPSVVHVLRLAGNRCSPGTAVEPWVLDAVAAAEASSDHPLATALVSYCRDPEGKNQRKKTKSKNNTKSRKDGDNPDDGSDAEQTTNPNNKSDTTRVIPGRGVTAVLPDGTSVMVGSRSFISSSTGWEPNRRTTRALSAWEATGSTVVVAALNNKPALAFGVADALRPESADVVATLRKQGVDVWMVTGDGKATAMAVASAVGIPAERVVAEALPATKVAAVEMAKTAPPLSASASMIVPVGPSVAALTAAATAADSSSDDDSDDSGSPGAVDGARAVVVPAAGDLLASDPSSAADAGSRRRPWWGARLVHRCTGRGEATAFDAEGRPTFSRTVAFVGDGINDAPALTAADLGVAMGGRAASTAASASAGIVLVRACLGDALVMMDLAKSAFKRIRLNYGWALGYNVAAIPVAAGALYPALERRLPPYMAAVAMAASSLCVVGCALTLRLYKPPKVLGEETAEEPTDADEK